jgi:TRAP-type C4-dicarboxylate transport system permease small subunit
MKIVTRIVNIQLAVAMLALLTMGAATAGDVFMKYLFNRPIVGAYDLVESLLPIVIFYGLPATILRRKSIVIDLVDHLAGPRARRGLIAVSDLTVLAVLAVMTWALVAPAKLAFDYGDRKIELGLPLAAIWAAVILGMGGVILAALANAMSPAPEPRPQGDGA